MASYLVAATIDIPNPGYTLEHNISNSAFHKKYDRKIQVQKIILHPGEVNTIKPWAKNPLLVATHSDSSYVFVWDMQTAESATERKDAAAHTPLLMLAIRI